MGEGEPNPEWDEIAENTGLDHEQVPFVTQLVHYFSTSLHQELDKQTN